MDKLKLKWNKVEAGTYETMAPAEQNPEMALDVWRAVHNISSGRWNVFKNEERLYGAGGSTMTVAKAYDEQHVAATASVRAGHMRLKLHLLVVPTVARVEVEGWPEVWITSDESGSLMLWSQEPEIWRASELGFKEEDGWFIPQANEGTINWSPAGFLNLTVVNWRECKIRIR